MGPTVLPIFPLRSWWKWVKVVYKESLTWVLPFPWFFHSDVDRLAQPSCFCLPWSTLTYLLLVNLSLLVKYSQKASLKMFEKSFIWVQLEFSKLILGNGWGLSDVHSLAGKLGMSSVSKHHSLLFIFAAVQQLTQKKEGDLQHGKMNTWNNIKEGKKGKKSKIERVKKRNGSKKRKEQRRERRD